MDAFAHLRVHSAYSLSEGASKVEYLVSRAREAGIAALALTDKDNLFGAMKFADSSAKAGVQPIMGIQMHLEWAQGRRGNIVLLAQDAQGYSNLCAMLRSASEAKPSEAGFSLDPDVLRDRSAGVIMLTGGGEDGLLPQMIDENPEAAADTFQWLLQVFGDRLYVEICRSGPPGEAKAAVEDALIALATGEAGEVACEDGELRAGAPLVATSDVWYASPERHEAWRLLQAVVTKASVTMDGDEILGAGEPLHYLRSPDEMKELFADLPEAFENAANVALRCSFMAQTRKPILPAFPCEGTRTEAEELAEQARAGLAARLAKAGIEGSRVAEYRERLEFELGVIQKMGFPGYFLIVSDFIKWAKAQDIPVGPGRGSGAGSVVAWALTITDLDPLEFGLLFERFLNPDRISMPDFDIDFCQDRREEVRDYVIAKYGADRVALIATFGVIRSKTALTDMQRILEHQQHGRVGFQQIKELTKTIPKKEEEAQPMDLEEAYEKAEDFRGRIDADPAIKNLFMQARRIEGLLRSSGAHAAGVVIGDRPLDQLVPIIYDHEAGMPVAGFDMKYAEAAGLVKFDFLGLTTLTVLQLALRYVKEFRGVDLDLSMIPRDDAEVYARLADGQCTGVFQFEGGGMRKVMRQIRPERFEDLIAIVALFRPGPMAFIGDYAARKAGEQQFSYPGGAERTERYLAETYGIMVYQEQVMQVAQACAGYSLGGADLLRRAMGKKDAKEMARQHRIFVHGDPTATPPVPGAVKLGMTEHEAEELFDAILPFANYGFNKSHAAAYAWIGYQTAWMKLHYPAEYLSALMTCYTDKTDRLALIKEELEALGVPLLLPDVNSSYDKFRPEPCEGARGGLGVRFGLAAIKQISGAGADLSDERRKGPFRSLEDFHNRVGGRFNKAHLEKLAEAGAFDSLSPSRRAAADSLAWLAGRKDTAPTGQADMFGGVAAVQVPPERLTLPEWGNAAEREFKALGFYVSLHPIDRYLDRLIAAGVRRMSSFYDYMRDRGAASLDGRRLCVMVDRVETKRSQAGTTFVEAAVSEKSATYFIPFYPRAGQQTAAQIREILDGAKASRAPVVVLGSLAVNREGTGARVYGRAVWDIETFLASVRGDLVVNIDLSRLDDAAAHLLGRVRMPDGTPIATALRACDPASAEGARARAAADEALCAHVIQDLLGYLQRVDGSASPRNVHVRLPDGSQRLLGRFAVDDVVESMLKQIRAVSSITETAPGSPGARPVPRAPDREPDEDADEEDLVEFSPSPSRRVVSAAPAMAPAR